MAGLCEGGNELSGSLKAISKLCNVAGSCFDQDLNVLYLLKAGGGHAQQVRRFVELTRTSRRVGLPVSLAESGNRIIISKIHTEPHGLATEKRYNEIQSLNETIIEYPDKDGKIYKEWINALPQIINKYKPVGRRNVGRPRMRWSDQFS
ncbi:hypothetical protein ANN_15012 [Periplaneta americana]|uniref:Uncharacterized protein n=1 Tax=Periplaneta americana TaxID=6978 RepID=A0ABQ8SZ39_PERAM|nr:hypothetical protein ANN_15012 [Periplaneta americana]